MYQNFLGISCSPFEDRADTKFLHLTPENEEILAAMQFEIRHGSGVLLVVGEPGTGKTTLARALLGRLSPTEHAVVLACPKSDAYDVMREACKGFGVSLPGNRDQTRCLNRLRRHLTRLHRAGKRGVLILDQAENLSAENLWELASLLDLYGDSGRLLSVLILATHTICQTLERPEFTRLRQHLFGKRTLEPLARDQTENYVAHRLHLAGALDPHMFDPDAIRLIFEQSRGVPRLINRLCNSALVAAYAEQRTKVSAAMVMEASGERVTPIREKDRKTIATPVTAPEYDALESESTFAEPQPLHQADVRQPFSRMALEEDQPRSSDFEDTGEFDAEGRPGPATIVRLGGNTPLGSTGEINSPPDSGDINSHAAERSTLDHLNRALARAERMTRTTEATVDKAAAIEQHLASLLDRAERVAQALQGSAQSHADSLIRAEKRINALLSDAQSCGAAVQNSLTNAATSTSESQTILDRIAASCVVAERLESRLSSRAHEFAERAGEVRTQVEKLVGAVGGAREAQTTLDAAALRIQKVISDQEQRAAQTLDAAKKRFDAAQEKIEKALVDAEQRAADIALSIKANLDAASESNHASAAEVERRAEQAAHTTTAQVDDAERKLRTAAVEVEQRAEHARSTIRDALKEVESETQRAQSETLERLHAVCQNQSAQIERTTHRALDELKQRMDEILREGAEISRQCEKRLEAAVDDAGVAGATRLQTIKSEIDAALSEADSAASRSMETAICSHRRALREFEDATTEQLEAARSSVNALDSRVSELNKRVETIVSQFVQTRSDADDLTDRTSRIEQRLQDAGLKTASLEAPLRAAFQQAESSLDTLRSATQQAQSMQHQAAATLVDVGMACERIRVAREEINRVESLADAFASQLAAAPQQVHVLHEAAAAAEAVIIRINAGTSDAQHCLARAEAFNQKAKELAEQLDSNVSNARTAIREVTRVSEELSDSRQKAADEHERLSENLTPARQVATELHESSQSGRKMLDSIYAALTDAEDKVARFASHHAAAVDVLNRLTHANLAAHSAIGRMQSADTSFTTSTGAAQEKLETLIQAGKEGASRLDAQLPAIQRAAETLETLQNMIEPTRRLIVELNEHAEQGRAQDESLRQVLGHSNRAAEQLSAVSRLLVESRETGDEIRKSIDQARSVQESAESVVANAITQSTVLQKSLTDAEIVVSRCQDLTANSAALEDKLEHRQAAIEAGQRLLAEFVLQAEDLSRNLKEIHRQSSEVEAKIDELTSRPAAILEGARNQSAELEKVCAAVRKVFAGLSQAGLDARRQLTELRSASAEAGAQLQRFASENRRLQLSTQPEFSAPLEVHSRTRLAGELERTTARTTTVATDAIADMTRSRTPRVQEIARLLEEAKRAEAAASSGSLQAAGAG